MKADLTGVGIVELPDGWSAGRAARLIEQRREIVSVVSGREYDLLGVRWYAGGAFIRESLPGRDIGARSLQRVRAGDLIYNRLFAWKGSFALIGADLDGTYVSNEFPVFRARKGSDLRFVKHYLCQSWLWEYISAESTGATAISRNRWKEENLRSLRMPIPPTETQRNVADFLDEEMSRVEAVMELIGGDVGEDRGGLQGLLLERQNALITEMVFGRMKGGIGTFSRRKPNSSRNGA